MDQKTKATLAEKYRQRKLKSKPKTDKNRGSLSDQTDSVGDLYRKYGLKK